MERAGPRGPNAGPRSHRRRGRGSAGYTTGVQHTHLHTTAPPGRCTARGANKRPPAHTRTHTPSTPAATHTTKGVQGGGTALDAQLGAAPVTALGVVAHGVTRAHADPLRDGPVLAGSLGQRGLGAQALVRRHCLQWGREREWGWGGQGKASRLTTWTC